MVLPLFVFLKRSVSRRVTMPAIASLEDLRAAQKEGVSIYAMRYACLP
jgi:hypothetical protein